ncbi:hypothetical protein ACIRD3_40315 [Kitasatospora sp. NPDC093550]|uniref:hypothetical protein n=1 Tax=Kitasatospora sp. NPDC093550 TaxID=3364089 RepID=UPI00380F14B3
MTSRHNEAVLARREKLRAQQKAELEAAKQRHSQQATALATVDRELALLKESQARTRKAVVAAAELFGSEQDLADLIPLSIKEIRAMLREHADEQRATASQDSVPAQADKQLAPVESLLLTEEETDAAAQPVAAFPDPYAAGA